MENQNKYQNANSKRCEFYYAMRKVSLLIVLLLLPNISDASEPYDFISDVITSFELSNIASHRIKNAKDDSLIMQMKDIKVFNHEIDKAKAYIYPYLKSNNDLIRETAESYNLIYMGVIENNEKLLSQIEDLLNNMNELSSKQGTFLRALSENLAMNEELWRSLFQLTTYATYTLIDGNRTKDGKIAYLTITSQERKKLLKQLEQTWGDKVKKGLKAGQLPIEGSASILWKVLNDKWKSSDEK